MGEVVGEGYCLEYVQGKWSVLITRQMKSFCNRVLFLRQSLVKRRFKHFDEFAFFVSP